MVLEFHGKSPSDNCRHVPNDIDGRSSVYFTDEDTRSICTHTLYS